jgi:hypothetical protein
MRRLIFGLILTGVVGGAFGPLFTDAQSVDVFYVGSNQCEDCHWEEYENFMDYANKAKSDHSVRLMAPKLTSEELIQCYGCHTTGYGQPGGFRDFEQTPELGHVGCEECHGPGSEHVMTGDPADIQGKLTIEVCAPCHEDPRVRVINYKPLLHAGAH